MSIKNQTDLQSNRRVLEIRKGKSLSQYKFSSALGFSRGYINDIEGGRAAPSYKFMKSLLDVFNVNLNWLLFGIGEMYATADANLAPRMQDLFKVVEGLSDEQVAAVIAFARDKQRLNVLETQVLQGKDEKNISS